MKLVTLSAIPPLVVASIAHAAPDEEKLGKRLGYPVGNSATWYFDESVRVGSFTHQAEIPDIVQTAANATAEAGANSLGSDRQAFWNGVVRFYGKW